MPRCGEPPDHDVESITVYRDLREENSGVAKIFEFNHFREQVIGHGHLN